MILKAKPLNLVSIRFLECEKKRAAEPKSPVRSNTSSGFQVVNIFQEPIQRRKESKKWDMTSWERLLGLAKIPGISLTATHDALLLWMSRNRETRQGWLKRGHPVLVDQVIGTKPV